MKVFFSDAFMRSTRKYRSLKKSIQRKVDAIIENPVIFGEPLRGNLRGFYSCPVKKNFLIIYLYCRACRARSDHQIILCADCRDCPDETIKFIELGPHDKACGAL